ncbi:hypothetical protein FHR91_002707 [Erythrobacter lutimaris]|nr:hypothetical protein [Alteriqipengyuania lutimaris]
MAGQSILACLDQVRGQEQNRIGSGVFGIARHFAGKRRSVSATRDDRHPPGRFPDGRAHDTRYLCRGEREKFARSTGCEYRSEGVLKQEIAVRPVRAFVELQITIEMGDGKGQQSLADLVR